MSKQDLVELVSQTVGAGKAQLMDVHDGDQHVQISIE